MKKPKPNKKRNPIAKSVSKMRNKIKPNKKKKGKSYPPNSVDMPSIRQPSTLDSY